MKGTDPFSARATDEELIRQGKAGDEPSITTLYYRYYKKRKLIGREVNPDVFPYLEEVHIFDAFEETFMTCLLSFEPRKGKFKTFFRKVYRNAIWDQYHDLCEEKRYVYPFSLDAEVESFADEGLCLRDIIPSGEIMDDPRELMNFKEAYSIVGETPTRKETGAKEAVELVLFQGYSISEASAILGYSRYQIRYFLQLYLKTARRALGEGM